MVILFFRLFDSSKLVRGLNIAILDSKFSRGYQVLCLFHRSAFKIFLNVLSVFSIDRSGLLSMVILAALYFHYLYSLQNAEFHCMLLQINSTINVNYLKSEKCGCYFQFRKWILNLHKFCRRHWPSVCVKKISKEFLYFRWQKCGWCALFKYSR